MQLFKFGHDQCYGVTNLQHVPTYLNSTLVNEVTMVHQQEVNKQEQINYTNDKLSQALPLNFPVKKIKPQKSQTAKIKPITLRDKPLINRHPAPNFKVVEKRLIGEGNTQSKLIILLHHAIEKYKSYPMSAMQLEREGQVTISFILHPNGRIENLTLEQTSGTRELDQAALHAVTLAAPFTGVGSYLQEPKLFKFKIDFELTDK